MNNALPLLKRLPDLMSIDLSVGTRRLQPGANRVMDWLGKCLRDL